MTHSDAHRTSDQEAAGAISARSSNIFMEIDHEIFYPFS